MRAAFFILEVQAEVDSGRIGQIVVRARLTEEAI
jgi:hypothetical protein